jgi:cystathionine beta-lyase/cystathionine gamma-synthase
MSEKDRRSPGTRAIHGREGGREGAGRGREVGAPVAPPVVQSATFHSGGPDDGGVVIYSRYGHNPNQLRVAERIAALEGTETGLVLASGMSAISLTLLSLVRPGDHLVSSGHLYGATRTFMEEELPRRGVRATFVDPGEAGAWEEALEPRTRLLYLEVPANPTLRVFDPRPVAEVARGPGIPLVVDATMASPVNLRPAELGAELVLHSATKYLGGHSDLVAGVVSGPPHRIEAITELLRLYGSALDPHAAWLLERGLRTLEVRMERHGRNASELARRFRGHPAVESVVYPGLPDHPDHGVAAEILHGFGGMLGLVLRGGAAAADAFCRGLRLAAVAPSLGGVETLVSQPRLTSHRSASPEARAAAGIPEGFVRISVGIEGLEDLEADLLRALEGVSAAG